MTPALSILCAVLVAVVAWQRLTLRRERTISQAIQARMSDGLDEMDAQIESSVALLAEAHALLHDTAARGKDGRWLPWSERRAAWVKKCEARG